MQTSQRQAPSISHILKKISDDKALVLFNSIAVTNEDKYIPLKEMNLTTKQYYTRVSGLLDAGLVKRHKGKYSLRQPKLASHNRLHRCKAGDW